MAIPFGNSVFQYQKRDKLSTEYIQGKLEILATFSIPYEKESLSEHLRVQAPVQQQEGKGKRSLLHGAENGDDGLRRDASHRRLDI
jgi:hypothetical protein